MLAQRWSEAWEDRLIRGFVPLTLASGPVVVKFMVCKLMGPLEQGGRHGLHGM